MINDRLRVPHDPTYFHAIGLAAVAFARLEWNAVWCIHRLLPGYIRTIEAKKKTAGIIAKDLKAAFSRIENVDLSQRCAPLANEFERLVAERNRLFHGKPGTAPNGEQRLFKSGTEWTIQLVNAFSDQCVEASSPLNALLYNELKEPASGELNVL